ncbi:unnamed protein product [Boreogadus saida]
MPLDYHHPGLEEHPYCSGLVLRCESVGWFPRPQLSWWTDGGLPLPADTMNTTRDPTGLYTINSTVDVERGQGAGNYTCRVHQERFNQTREAEIALHVPAPCYRGSSGCLMAVLLLLLMLPKTQLHGQPLTTTALVGEDVSLSYDPEVSTDLTETPLRCYTDKMIGTNDFVFKKDKPPRDNSKRLNPAYRGRTRLLDEDLKRGIVSLRLYNVTRADEGNYCFVLPSGRFKIQLLIGAVSSATITLEKRPDCSGLVLRCESVGWYPRPQLSWWTDGGLRLPAVTMNTTWDPTGLYTINSTVDVERGQGAGNYTCRVHQERFNQTREAEIALHEDQFPSWSRREQRPLRWLFPALVIFVFALVALVLVVIGVNRFNQTREAEIALHENQFLSCPRHHWWVVPALVNFVLVALVLVVIAEALLTELTVVWAAADTNHQKQQRGPPLRVPPSFDLRLENTHSSSSIR